MHASLIETVKIMGYHYIARNQQKYVNRLIYILLEHLVQHCHRHPYLNSIMERSGEGEKYVGEAIELFMQERVEGAIGEGRLAGNGNINSEIQEKYEKLRRQYELQREELQQVSSKLAREEKKMLKLVNKYNAMADLTYELRCKQTQQLSLMQQEYEAALSQANQRFQLEREEAIRLSVKMQYLQKENLELRTRLNNQTANSYVFDSIGSKSKKTFESIRSMSIFIDRTLSNVKEDIKKQYSMTKCESIDLIPIPLPSKQSRQTQTLNQIHHESSQTFIENHFQECQTTVFELNNAQTQAHIEEGIVLGIEQQTSTDLSLNQLHQMQELAVTTKNELIILDGLNSFYFKNYNQIKTTHAQQTQQLHKITKYYNGLFDKHQEYREQQQIQNHQKDAQIAELHQQVQQLLTEREDLISLVQSQHVQPIIPHFEHLEFLRNADLSEQTEASEATPRRKLEEDQPQSNQSETTQPSPLCSSKLDEFIKKETISKYILQMLDDGCKGETKAAILHQIGECLGWSGDDMRILQLHSRRVRLKQELQSQSTLHPQTFKDRFYHFLTNESDGEE